MLFIASIKKNTKTVLYIYEYISYISENLSLFCKSLDKYYLHAYNNKSLILNLQVKSKNIVSAYLLYLS